PGALVATGDVPVGGGVILAAQKVVVTQPTAGTFKAFDTTCTHQGCTVNAVANGTIDCPCHGSRYAVADGSVVDGPAPAPLPEQKITVEGTTISLA
ncbi:Rieske (2Fe-2S) protein, partial [Pseudonocardia sp.]